MSVSEETKSILDVYIDNMNSVLDEQDEIRKQLISEMLTIKDHVMRPDVIVDPDLLMARMSVFNTINHAMNDRDKGRIKKVDVQMKRKSEENNSAVGKLAVELLKNITVADSKKLIERNISNDRKPEDETDIENKLDEVFEKNEITISKTELKDSHSDLSYDD